MRSTAGPFAKAAAIAFGAVGVLASRMTFPSRSMTQTCVSSIETSNPAKYSMAALLFLLESRYYRLSGSSRPLPDVAKVIELELRAGADAFLRKPPFLAGLVIRIASGQRGIKRDDGGELCQLPQILGGRCKQEFVASTACSSQPQSSEPQDPLEMRK